MKLLEADKHFITEYYIRKGYIVVRKGTTTPILQLTKRDSKIECSKVWAGIKVREFIENVDKFLNEVIK